MGWNADVLRFDDGGVWCAIVDRSSGGTRYDGGSAHYHYLCSAHYYYLCSDYDYDYDYDHDHDHDATSWRR